jgi:hypothetical protein
MNRKTGMSTPAISRSPPTCGVAQSAVCLFVRPTRSGIMAATKTSAPTTSRSRGLVGRFRPGSTRLTTRSEMSPSGRLTKKIQCQLKLSVMIPPRASPISAESPKTAPNRPWYLPRSTGVNRSPMTASEIGKSEPAPMPWMPRKRISCHISPLRPESAHPIRKTEIPKMSSGFRP